MQGFLQRQFRRIFEGWEDEVLARSLHGGNAFGAIKHTQLPFKDAKQAFDIAMFLT